MCHVASYNESTVVWEIFVVKKFRVTIFRKLNVRFRGHPRKFITGFIEKIYRARRQDGRVGKLELCVFVAITFIVISVGGSCWTICEREPRNTKDRYAVAVQNRSFAYILNYQASLKNNELLQPRHGGWHTCLFQHERWRCTCYTL